MSVVTTRDAYERLDDLITEWSRVAYPSTSEQANDLSQASAERARQDMLRVGTQLAEALIEAPGALAYIKRRAGRPRQAPPPLPPGEHDAYAAGLASAVRVLAQGGWRDR